MIYLLVNVLNYMPMKMKIKTDSHSTSLRDHRVCIESINGNELQEHIIYDVHIKLFDKYHCSVQKAQLFTRINYLYRVSLHFSVESELVDFFTKSHEFSVVGESVQRIDESEVIVDYLSLELTNFVISFLPDEHSITKISDLQLNYNFRHHFSTTPLGFFGIAREMNNSVILTSNISFNVWTDANFVEFSAIANETDNITIFGCKLTILLLNAPYFQHYYMQHGVLLDSAFLSEFTKVFKPYALLHALNLTNFVESDKVFETQPMLWMPESLNKWFDEFILERQLALRLRPIEHFTDDQPVDDIPQNPNYQKAPPGDRNFMFQHLLERTKQRYDRNAPKFFESAAPHSSDDDEAVFKKFVFSVHVVTEAENQLFLNQSAAESFVVRQAFSNDEKYERWSKELMETLIKAVEEYDFECGGAIDEFEQITQEVTVNLARKIYCLTRYRFYVGENFSGKAVDMFSITKNEVIEYIKSFLPRRSEVFADTEGPNEDSILSTFAAVGLCQTCHLVVDRVKLNLKNSGLRLGHTLLLIEDGGVLDVVKCKILPYNHSNYESFSLEIYEQIEEGVQKEKFIINTTYIGSNLSPDIFNPLADYLDDE